MISVSSFREKDLRIWKMHKITNNFIKNSGSNLMLNKLVGVNQRNIHTKFATNPCSGSIEEISNGILHGDIKFYIVNIHVT